MEQIVTGFFVILNRLNSIEETNAGRSFDLRFFIKVTESNNMQSLEISMFLGLNSIINRPTVFSGVN